jgi:hypothetical protein
LALLQGKHPDLALVVERWPRLSRHAKAEIVEIIKSRHSRIERAVADQFEKP